jgi:membrane-bound ClpP family serine protease
LPGATGIAMGLLDPLGLVMVEGEIWNAESVGGNIQKNEKVRVKEMKDLKLYVEKVNT